MKLALLCLLAATSAFAVEDAPAYFTKVKGTLLTSIISRDTFEFSPGKIDSCAHNVVGGGGSGFKLESFNCKVEGVSVKVAGANGVAKEYSLQKLFVFYKYQKNGDVIREYKFTGDFSEKGSVIDLKSELNLVLWYYASDPERINGFIQLPSYSVANGLQGTQVKE